MARADGSHVDERRKPPDVDATEQLTPLPPAEREIAPAPAPPAGARRQADRWSTVFTVFAALALVALLLLGAAVISSQQLAAPSASPSPSASASASPTIAVTPIPRTAAPTPTPTPTSLPTTASPTAAPTTAAPTLPRPSLPVTLSPLPTRTP